ncbi:HNH endonuclease [Micromonospora wenchangensis]|uniref:HNH endonuclease n=1 Tax=Micromonospora wenchangensis TaxID=1185415 RepID=UPI00381573D6
MERRTPIARMSARRRAELAEQGNPRPFSTLTSGAVGRGSTARLAAPAPKRRTRPAVPAHIRAALVERSGGWCEIARPGCTGQGSDPSHRITQKAGGRHGEAKVRHDRLSNVMWACRACHRFVTANPAASKAEHVGWALEEWQNPATCPALYRGRLVLLGDDGTVTRFIPNHIPNQTTEVPA